MPNWMDDKNVGALLQSGVRHNPKSGIMRFMPISA